MRRAAVPILLVFGSVSLYFLLLVGFGVYQRVPVLHFLACIAGSLWLAGLFVRERTLGRAAVAGTAILLTAGYLWYTLSYSTYPPRTQPTVEGEVVTELVTLRLTNHEGVERPLLDPEGSRATLLILYRGYW